MVQTLDEAEHKIQELEILISQLRHGVNGALTPALMMADRLRTDQDPRVQLAGEKIAASIIRVTKLLKATRDSVPSRRVP